MESESGYINRLYLFNVLAVVCTKYYIGDTGSFGSQNFFLLFLRPATPYHEELFHRSSQDVV